MLRPKNMVLVKVHRITSVNDPETGHPGKQIELVEVRQKRPQLFMEGGDETRLVKGIISQFQSLGLFPQMRELMVPKVTLFLTEDEYDMLGLRLEVNDIYDLKIKDGSLKMEKPVEGV